MPVLFSCIVFVCVYTVSVCACVCVCVCGGGGYAALLPHELLAESVPPIDRSAQQRRSLEERRRC